ncbi:hypothetical protein COEREDRAFT_83118 [Coemansia reversa NRRL 1564]|uniref:Uncharacterized protein n=1 Tax=Coemansia reversa (strain ATCC 12441 / NRRL 1564) TaxID=763665 RepID=A0A2G5B4K7_COERN|nr:hypothetical protein COEREDRAFT_83118 [Coemansia reversa NRRL 1564]|eukprot:PIA13936.1 hypothetical protein COEREDRAFT_83118 [Coemansia reversa NRRL 1564]
MRLRNLPVLLAPLLCLQNCADPGCMTAWTVHAVCLFCRKASAVQVQCQCARIQLPAAGYSTVYCRKGRVLLLSKWVQSEKGNGGGGYTSS